MKFDLRNNKDFLAGLLFIMIGGLAVVIARDYPMGSAVRMGPGYFPTVLGGLLCLFGVFIFGLKLPYPLVPGVLWTF